MFKLLTFLAFWLVFKYLTGPEETAVDQRNFPSIAEVWVGILQALRDLLIWINKWVMILMGFEGVYTNDYLVAVQGYGGVVVGDPCLAIEMMALYSALVLATQASAKLKMAGLAFGIIGIQVINVARITAINLMTIYYPEYADIAHHYMFNTIVFIAILIMFNFFLRLDDSVKKQ